MSVQGVEHLHRLALYAGPGAIQTNGQQQLVNALKASGLIGSCIDATSGDYYPGEHFTELVTFLGCSPSIALSPEEGEQHCFIRIQRPQAAPQLYAGANTGAPKCSQCHQVREDWIHCDDTDFCAQCTLLERQQYLAWRRRGLLSRWVVMLTNIYPHEAVPTSQLLTLLGDVSGLEWGYAYLQAETRKETHGVPV